MRTYQLLLTGFTSQLYRFIMLNAQSLLLCILTILFFHIFDNIQNCLIFRKLICNTLSNHKLWRTLWTCEYFSICLILNFVQDTFFTKSMSTSWNNSGSMIIKIKWNFTHRTNWQMHFHSGFFHDVRYKSIWKFIIKSKIQ